VNEFDLTSAFAETRATVAPPPHGLTPQAMITAGRRARRRRRIGATAGGALAIVLAVTIGIGVVHGAPAGPYPQPVQPGQSSTPTTPTSTPDNQVPTIATTPAESSSVGTTPEVSPPSASLRSPSP
jgi:hypothetical protein